MQVGAQALDLLLDARLRAAADRDHGDHRADADDDAEHGERAAQLVHRAARAARSRSVATRFMPRPPAVSARRAASARWPSARRVARDPRPPCRRGSAMHAARERRDVVLVRDQHHVMPCAVELLQQRHDLEAGARVERAGRLVGEDQQRVVDQRARDRHALLLAAGELRRRGARRARRGRPAPASRSARARRSRAGDARIEQRQLDVLERRACAAAG